MTSSIAPLQFEHFSYAARALAKREGFDLTVRGDGVYETITATSNVLGTDKQLPRVATGLMGHPYASVCFVTICVDALTCRLVERSDGRDVPPVLRIQFGLWVIREWLRDNAGMLDVTPNDWYGLTSFLRDAMRLGVGSHAYLTAMGNAVDWFEVRVARAPRIGARSDDLYAFLAHPMTVGAEDMSGARQLAEYLQDELDRRRVQAWVPAEYHGSAGLEYADDPASKSFEERLIPHKDFMIIIHSAPASGLGSVADTARAWGIPVLIVHDGGRLSPRLTGGPNPPVIFDTRAPGWVSDLCAHIDAHRHLAVRNRTRRAARLQSADRRREEFCQFLQGLPTSALSRPWDASIHPAELRAALAYPELFARFAPEQLDEVRQALVANGEESIDSPAQLPVLSAVLASLLPPLLANERAVLDGVASNEDWTPELRESVELVGRAMKLPATNRQRRIRYGTGRLTDATTWIEIARDHER